MHAATTDETEAALVSDSEESQSPIARRQMPYRHAKVLAIAVCVWAIASASFAFVLSHQSKTSTLRGLSDAQEACGDSIADNSCENRREACESGRDKAQCSRCVYHLSCEQQSRYTGLCFGRGVACQYVLGHKIGPFCFPSNSTVAVLEGPGSVARRQMQDLSVGDRVLTAGGFSEVFAFMDHATAVEADFLRLSVASGAELVLSRDHIVFAHADKRPVLAAEVQEGDFLWVSQGAAARGVGQAPLQLSRVVAIATERAKGLHAPLTSEGSVIVNGVLASTSVAVQTLQWGGVPLLTGHRIGMLLHAPLRFVCKFAPSACGPTWHLTESGRHLWTQWVLDHLGWLQALNLQHHDLKVAFASQSITAWSALSAQVAAASVLIILDAVVFSLSPWQFVMVIALFWATGRHTRRGRNITS